MTNETDTMRLYCARSEAHAQKAVKAARHSIKESRKMITMYENMIARSLADLNEAKRVMYERGWKEETP